MGEMSECSDAKLLRDYAEHRDESAFREIVNRHGGLVYSAALRQVESSELAGDVAQTVFTNLARKARAVASQVAENSSLVGWLYRSTRFAALNQSRAARRRLSHERQAMEHMLANSETAFDWERIRPLLDEAMASLAEADRDAVLLRYFKGQEFRVVGGALGISEDAAQKRVSRAIERLRAFFTQRDVTLTGAAIAGAVSANAVQGMPVGLATKITTAALAGTTLTTTTATLMTTLQKTIIGAALAAAVGAGLFETGRALRLRNEVQALRREHANQLQLLSRERDEALGQLAGLREKNDRLNQNTAELLKLRAEATRLREDLKRAKHTSPRMLDAELAQPSVAPATTNLPSFETYSATARAIVPWGQAFLTGGWRTPTGKTAFILALPKHEDDPAVVLIEAQVLEVSDEAATKLGLQTYTTGDKQSQLSTVLSTELIDSIIKASSDTNSVAILDRPRISTPTGSSAAISSTVSRATSTGETYAVGPTLRITPTVSPDAQSVDLQVEANLTLAFPHQ